MFKDKKMRSIRNCWRIWSLNLNLQQSWWMRFVLKSFKMSFLLNIKTFCATGGKSQKNSCRSTQGQGGTRTEVSAEDSRHDHTDGKTQGTLRKYCAVRKNSCFCSKNFVCIFRASTTGCLKRRRQSSTKRWRKKRRQLPMQNHWFESKNDKQ